MKMKWLESVSLLWIEAFILEKHIIYCWWHNLKEKEVEEEEEGEEEQQQQRSEIERIWLEVWNES